MAGGADLEAAGERIEALLARLAELADPRPLEWAESLVRVITDLYGAGLSRLIDAGGPGFLERVAADEPVASLLMLHGLHPESIGRRVQNALDGLPPLLGCEDARVVEVDEETATVRVRVLVAPGRGRQKDHLDKVVREAVERAAPDVGNLVIDTPDTGVPVKLGKPRAHVATEP